MGQEIERKFLVTGEGWQDLPGPEKQIVQAYITQSKKAHVRVRIVDGNSALLTIKDSVAGRVRREFEYPIPLEDARAMLALRTGCLIEKTRKLVRLNGLVWEIDCFGGALEGLVLAEVELDEPEQALTLPGWLGPEVTDDPRYYNAALARSGAVP